MYRKTLSLNRVFPELADRIASLRFRWWRRLPDIDIDILCAADAPYLPALQTRNSLACMAGSISPISSEDGPFVGRLEQAGLPCDAS